MYIVIRVEAQKTRIEPQKTRVEPQKTRVSSAHSRLRILGVSARYLGMLELYIYVNDRRLLLSERKCEKNFLTPRRPTTTNPRRACTNGHRLNIFSRSLMTQSVHYTMQYLQ